MITIYKSKNSKTPQQHIADISDILPIISDSSLVDVEKTKLPVMVAAYSKGSKSFEEMIDHSGYIWVDIDRKDNLLDSEEIFNILKNDDFTRLVHYSYSGNIKCYVRSCVNIEDHKNHLFAYHIYLKENYGINVDKKVINVNHQNFLNYSPVYFYNPGSKNFNSTVNIEAEHYITPDLVATNKTLEYIKAEDAVRRVYSQDGEFHFSSEGWDDVKCYIKRGTVIKEGHRNKFLVGYLSRFLILNPTANLDTLYREAIYIKNYYFANTYTYEITDLLSVVANVFSAYHNNKIKIKTKKKYTLSPKGTTAIDARKKYCEFNKNSKIEEIYYFISNATSYIKISDIAEEFNLNSRTVHRLLTNDLKILIKEHNKNYTRKNKFSKRGLGRRQDETVKQKVVTQKQIEKVVKEEAPKTKIETKIFIDNLTVEAAKESLIRRAKSTATRVFNMKGGIQISEVHILNNDLYFIANLDSQKVLLVVHNNGKINTQIGTKDLDTSHFETMALKFYVEDITTVKNYLKFDTRTQLLTK